MGMARTAAVVAAGLVLALTGCGAGDGGSPAGAPYPEAPAETAAPQPDSGSGERQIARTAYITLVIDDVEQVAAELRSVAQKVGGIVTAERISLPGEGEEWPRDYSELVISVPAERLEESLGLIADVGEVRHRSIESVDVTDAVLDVDARVKTLRESIARLQELMSRAGSVAEIAQVEAELSQRQADLESLLAQQKSLQNRVAMTPITIGLYPPDRAGEAGAVGFVGGLVLGWNSLVRAGGLALTTLGVLLPWLAVAAVVIVPLVWWRRRRRAAAAARIASAPAPAPAPAPGDRVPPPAGPPAGDRRTPPAAPPADDRPTPPGPAA